MSDEARCPMCGGWPPERSRLTIPRKVTGDLVFCGLACWQRWDQRQEAGG